MNTGFLTGGPAAATLGSLSGVLMHVVQGTAGPDRIDGLDFAWTPTPNARPAARWSRQRRAEWPRGQRPPRRRRRSRPPGEDLLEGGRGNDTLRGGPGNHRLNGGLHRDRVYAGSGNDVVIAIAGSDHIDGEPGRDKAYVDRTDTVRNCEVIARARTRILRRRG